MKGLTTRLPRVMDPASEAASGMQARPPLRVEGAADPPEGRVAGLTLLKADDKTGYFGVRLGKRLLENDESKRTAHARAV